MHDHLERSGESRVEFLHIPGRVLDTLIHELPGGFPRKRNLSGSHLIKHDSQRVNVASAVDGLAFHLFR